MTRWIPLVVLVGLAWVGRGFLNGDSAAYCAQAWAGDLADRTVHLGYLLVAAWLAPLTDRSLPWALDVVNVLTATLAVAWAMRLANAGRAGLGLAAAAVVLPWAPFAEVDVPWIALVIGAAVGVPGAAGLAVAVSPTALLGLPWAAWHGRTPRPLLEGALAVVGLTVITAGDWWWGERGVLQPHPWLIGRNLASWVDAVPWLVVLTGRPDLRPALWLAPLLLAPADVPAAVLVGIAVVAASAPDRSPGRLQRVARVSALLWVGLGAVHATGQRADRVADEHATILTVLRRHDPGDGLVAPFTWGARASVIATDDPYGLAWHPEGRFLRDQQAQWAHVDGAIRVLGPARSATPPGHSSEPTP